VNLYNLLAAAGAAFARGLNPEEIARGAASLAFVPGRFQTVDVGQAFAVVVDYAHTDDALRNLTALAREFVDHPSTQQRHAGAAGIGGKGRVITLFGCGGDRDRAKRPKMGRAAGEGSDFVVLTSDNPRSEDPEAIMADALPGLLATGTKFVAEPDRARAIRLAIEAAHPGDIVLIAGKGHEKEQVLRDQTIPFDDGAVAAAAIRELMGVRA
jgi:UDP-N-acetylmuramoyl-L-alanyl-D-glutamate--2,6-diaminopimelate ligase